MLLVNAVQAYLSSRLACNCRPATVSNYRGVLVPFIRHCRQGHVHRVEAVTPPLLREFVGARLAQGYAPGTVEHDRVTIIQLLNWCAMEGYCESQAWGKRVQAIKRDRRHPRHLSAEECRRLLLAVETHPHKCEFNRTRDMAILCVLLDTGLRVGELSAIRLVDVDVETRSIYVRAGSKSRRDRIVWFGSRTVRAVCAYLAVRRSPSGWLWLSQRRDRLARGSIQCQVKRLIEAAGIRDASVHTLRHTAATMLYCNGLGLLDIAETLGHQNLATTEIYTHLVEDESHARYNEASPVDHLGR